MDGPTVLGIVGAITGIVGFLWSYRQSIALERFRSDRTRELASFTSDQQLKLAAFTSDQQLKLAAFNTQQTRELETFKSQKSVEIENIRHINELEADYDKDLRIRRIDAYQKLWVILQEWETSEKVKQANRAEVSKLYKAIENWYNNIGGLFLTNESHEAFIQLHHALVLEFSGLNEDFTEKPETNTRELWKQIEKVLKPLREQMLKDINTRKIITLGRIINPASTPAPVPPAPVPPAPAP